MRSFTFLLLLCSFSRPVVADNRVSPTISEVTVYRSGAKVSSVAMVKVAAGNSEVIFENLSPYIHASSMLVKIRGEATLISAVFSLKTPGTAPESPLAPVLRDSLVLLGDELMRLRDERDVLNMEQKLITENTSRVGTVPEGQPAKLPVAELKALSEFYRQRILEIKDRLLQLSIKERKVNELYKKLQADLQNLQPNASNQTGEIALKIEASSAQTLEITCTYLVTQAGWKPIYDLRSAGLDKPLQLVYKANVHNRSGFDWKGVKLHLSTAIPMANNDRPILNPMFVDYRYIALYQKALEQPATTAEATQIESGNVNIRGSRGQSSNYYIDGIRESGSMPSAQETEQLHRLLDDTEAESGQEDVVANFDLPKLQDIIANGKDNVIIVEERDIPAAYEYHTVPKLEPSVFLLAKITDYGKYNLLPGTANLFFQDTYVGQAWVNPQVAADTLLLSLGRDEQIAIKRIQPQDLTERKKIFGSTIKETYTYEISIKNNKSAPITVDVLDQIPISKQKDIEVELEDRGSAQYDADPGKLEWQVLVPAGQTKKLRFTYSVKYPKGQAIGMFKQ
ncbi:MAG: hypothetical protein EPGJADBJ_02987 [Saprospiraceae bacterium]|nr:hypothetical protein [Saprospiraceae bacterium]